MLPKMSSMIHDIAVIISAYALARLLNEYIFTGEKASGPRLIVAIAAVAIIGVFLASILSTAGGIGDLNL
jgi:hypothetical protein